MKNSPQNLIQTNTSDQAPKFKDYAKNMSKIVDLDMRLEGKATSKQLDRWRNGVRVMTYGVKVEDEKASLIAV